ncbi:hypothetical protein [Burkholderia ambifaria]|uniref:hypothetical protein n=1 Tax=Burkholderia ambifaria TaxID=152480 RepID=UPI00158B54DB|nr:hypothetical protein [Burkholderia ambifaria]
MAAIGKTTTRPLAARSGISNVISKKMCTLEIDLEITTALPDKAHRPKRRSISKSPDIFVSGGAVALLTASAFGCSAYANASVGIFVGI